MTLDNSSSVRVTPAVANTKNGGRVLPDMPFPRSNIGQNGHKNAQNHQNQINFKVQQNSSNGKTYVSVYSDGKWTMVDLNQ